MENKRMFKRPEDSEKMLHWRSNMTEKWMRGNYLKRDMAENTLEVIEDDIL
jgi:hypothetical protein